MTKPDRLTSREVGAKEYLKVLDACDRFESYEKAQKHAERYGQWAVDCIGIVKDDINFYGQSSRTCEAALDAYNLARMAHHGWRALRGI